MVATISPRAGLSGTGGKGPKESPVPASHRQSTPPSPGPTSTEDEGPRSTAWLFGHIRGGGNKRDGAAEDGHSRIAPSRPAEISTVRPPRSATATAWIPLS